MPAAQTDTTRGGLGPLPSKTSSSSAAAAASSNTNLPKSSSAGSLLLHQLNPSTKGPSSSYATLAASAAAAAVTMRSHDFELEEIQEPEALAPAEVSAMDARSRSKLCDIKLHQQDLLYKKINDIVGILRPFQHRAKTLATTNTTLLSSSSSSNSTLVCDVQAAISLSDLIRNEQIILMISERGLEWYLEALVGRYNALQQQINMLQ